VAVVVHQDPRGFVQVDVFSERAGAGNPLAVVLDADGLDDAAMQRIAAWTNLAETTFLLPPDTPGADYRVRIFTTRQEIAFAGHPSIGSAHAALSAGLCRPREGRLVQQCKAGLLPIDVADDGTLSVRVPRSRIVRRAGDGHVDRQQGDDALLQAALGDVPTLTAALVEGGRRWWLAELADEAAVRGFAPDRAAIGALAAATDSLGLCLFARTGARDPASPQLVVRAFPLGVGIAEDPASGAANAAIAAFLDEAGALGQLGDRFTVSQGREMGRDARLVLRIDAERQVWVGGQCRPVVTGTLRW
jgi:PhzF family phenazine biosynthesis protein